MDFGCRGGYKNVQFGNVILFTARCMKQEILKKHKQKRDDHEYFRQDQSGADAR